MPVIESKTDLMNAAKNGDIEARRILIDDCRTEEEKARLYKRWRVDTANLDELGDPQLA